MKIVLKEFFKKGSFSNPKADLPYSMPLYKLPDFFTLFRYQYKSLLLIFKVLFEKLFNINFRWSVRYQYRNWDKLVMWKSNEIKNPKGSFLADPFLVRRNGNDYIFVEEYNYSTSKGHISAYQLKNGKEIYLGKVLEENFHLSYPMIFEYENNLYMVPETSKTKSIRLYKCIKFPKIWSYEKTLMKDIDAADNTIFYYKNKWWMFVNIDPVMRGDHCSELFLFWNNNPLTSEWISHKKNPLSINPLVARMGGIIQDKGFIYRIAQTQAFNLYGKSSIIFRIKKLNEEDYLEEKICKNFPNFSQDIIGTHHMHSCGGLTVFDCLRKRSSNK